MNSVKSFSQTKTIAIFSCGEVIGDGIFKIAFLQECRLRFLDAWIVWVAGLGTSDFAGSIASIIDEVIENVDIGAVEQLAHIKRRLKDRNFDLVVDTQRNVLRALCARHIRHGTFLSGIAGFSFLDLKPYVKKVAPRSLLEQFKLFLNLVFGQLPKPLPKIKLHRVYIERTSGLLPKDPDYLEFMPVAGDVVKTWPLDNFVTAAPIHKQAVRTPVFILCPNEFEWGEKIRPKVPSTLLPPTISNAIADQDGPIGPALVTPIGGRLVAALFYEFGGGHMLTL